MDDISPLLVEIEEDKRVRKELESLRTKYFLTGEEESRLIELTYVYYVLHVHLRDMEKEAH